MYAIIKFYFFFKRLERIWMWTAVRRGRITVLWHRQIKMRRQHTYITYSDWSRRAWSVQCISSRHYRHCRHRCRLNSATIIQLGVCATNSATHAAPALGTLLVGVYAKQEANQWNNLHVLNSWRPFLCSFEAYAHTGDGRKHSNGGDHLIEMLKFEVCICRHRSYRSIDRSVIGKTRR